MARRRADPNCVPAPAPRPARHHQQHHDDAPSAWRVALALALPEVKPVSSPTGRAYQLRSVALKVRQFS